MQTLHDLLDFVLHVDKRLDGLLSSYGALTYGILFLIVFVETGIVIWPFLPGDSLLFAAGAIAARPAHALNPWALAGVFIGAAALGDTCNYWIGRTIGPRALRSERSRWLNRKHLEKAHAFFEKYGPWAIVLARFIPIVRTFMPFTAGVGAMPFPRFLAFGFLGSLLWVGLFLNAGYWFGNIPFVRDNFALVVLAIIVVSALPAAVGAYKAWRESKSAAPGA